MTPTLIRSLYLIRRVEEECCRIYHTDKIQSPFHSSIGMELASAAVCAALGRGDCVNGSYRSHALYLAAGGDLNAFVAELFGKVTGCARGKGGSMHLSHKGLTSTGLRLLRTDAIVSAGIPVAMGYAAAQKFLRTGAVTATFFGDGACEEGVFFESLNFAALHCLPILFVCENNGLAIHSHLSTRQASPIARRVEAMGVPAATISDFDENGMTASCVEDVRAGFGPRFLEVIARRDREHVGPGTDWHQGYRSVGGGALPGSCYPDAVARAQWELSDQALQQMLAEIDSAIAAAFKFAEESPEPGPEELMADLYG